jgi:septal ring factor EnvC (AmiA/AmiB activator)
MNTLGKILVIMNFVFALVVCAFLTLKFATEQNWKAGVDQLRSELEITRKSNQALNDTTTALQTALTATKSQLEARNQDLAFQQTQAKFREDELQKAVKDAEARFDLETNRTAISLAAAERMKKEVDDLKLRITEREDILVKLQGKFKDSQDLVLSLDRDLQFSMERNKGLLQRVKELETNLSEIVSGTRSDTAGALAKDPNAPNPPLKFMKGVVEKVHSQDNSLVQISLGTDHGLKVNNTLEVYRRSPNVMYIGVIRIEDTHNHQSVGRLIRAPGVEPRTIRVGDEVSSSLSPR